MSKSAEVIKFFQRQYKIHVENNRTNKKLQKYYMERKKDARSNIGKTLDYIGIRIAIFSLCIIFFWIKIGHLYISLTLALICASIFHVINIIIRNKKMMKMIQNRRKYFASQRIYKDIMNKNAAEFCEFIYNLLIRSGFIIKNTKFLNDRNILFVSTYKCIELLILCKRYNNDNSVHLKEIKDFHKTMLSMSAKRGLIISTADFTKECQDYVDQYLEDETIILIDKDVLLKIINQAGMFPSDSEMDEYIIDRMEKQQKKLIAYKEVLLSKTKVKSYFMLALFLFLWAQYTAFTFYYKIISIFLVGLALTTIYSNIKRKAAKERDFCFDELFKK